MKKLIICFWVFVILAGCTFTSESKFEVGGNSMLPTIKDKQTILVDKKYYENHPVKIGDIVVYKISDDHMSLKRVVGLPNDFLQIKEGTVFIDHKPINHKFIFSKVVGNDQLETGITLKKDEYFVIGDNAQNSLDSRRRGPINKKDIIGKVIKLNVK